MLSGPRRQPPGRQSGFTLIELLIVVAILAMLASMGVVQLSRARMTTFEQIALTTLRHLHKSCHQFYAVNSQFPSDLRDLATPNANPPYIDSLMAGDGTTVDRQGYRFVYERPNPDEPANPVSFRVLANPQQHGVTGERHFYMSHRNELFFTAQDRDATPADPPLP